VLTDLSPLFRKEVLDAAEALPDVAGTNLGMKL
jgi:hypothetical protein